MNVIAHGAVEDFCRERGMVIVGRHSGDLDCYYGDLRVLVTGEVLDKNEFYYLKYKLLRRGVTLISTRWDIADLNDFVLYLNERYRGNYHGRPKFGFVVKDGVVLENPEKMALAKRILELRDSGKTLREIHAEIDCLSIGTIRTILRNRVFYER